MSNINSVIVSGRLTRDPELKHLPSGTAVAELGLAVNYSKKNAETGEWEDEPNFFDVSVYGGRGEVLASKGRKGDSITVAGRLQQRRWTTDDDQKREKVSIVAQNVEGELFFRKADGSDTPEASTPSQSDDIPF